MSTVHRSDLHPTIFSSLFLSPSPTFLSYRVSLIIRTPVILILSTILAKISTRRYYTFLSVNIKKREKEGEIIYDYFVQVKGSNEWFKLKRVNRESMRFGFFSSSSFGSKENSEEFIRYGWIINF